MELSVRFKWPVIHSNIMPRYNKKHKAVMLQHRPISAHGTMAMQGNIWTTCFPIQMTCINCLYSKLVLKHMHVFITHNQHLAWPVLHSLNELQSTCKHLPLHVIPSPVYPVLHTHVKDSSVLIHKAFA